MATNVVSKNLKGGGSTPGNRVVYHVYDANASLTAQDFTFARGSGAVGDSEYVPVRIIESVINMGQSAVTIDGKDFETGRWELSMHGGIRLDTAGVCAITFGTANQGNVLIEFRS